MVCSCHLGRLRPVTSGHLVSGTAVGQTSGELRPRRTLVPYPVPRHRVGGARTLGPRRPARRWAPGHLRDHAPASPRSRYRGRRSLDGHQTAAASAVLGEPEPRRLQVEVHRPRPGLGGPGSGGGVQRGLPVPVDRWRVLFRGQNGLPPSGGGRITCHLQERRGNDRRVGAGRVDDPQRCRRQAEPQPARRPRTGRSGP